jgi:hypothetical protein
LNRGHREDAGAYSTMEKVYTIKIVLGQKTSSHAQALRNLTDGDILGFLPQASIGRIVNGVMFIHRSRVNIGYVIILIADKVGFRAWK